MSDRDTITLPRVVVKFVLQHLEWWSDDEPQEKEAIEVLRTALAAEQPKPEPVAVFDEQMGHPVLLLGSPMLKDKQPLYTATPDAEALRRDAERWRFYEAAGSNLTLRLHNTRSDHRNAAIDAAMGDKT